MAESYNFEKSDRRDRKRSYRQNNCSDIEYDDAMDTKLHRFDDYDEEITFGRSGGFTELYATQFAGGDASTTITQPDEDSNIGPVEMTACRRRDCMHQSWSW